MESRLKAVLRTRVGSICACALQADIPFARSQSHFFTALNRNRGRRRRKKDLVNKLDPLDAFCTRKRCSVVSRNWRNEHYNRLGPGRSYRYHPVLLTAILISSDFESSLPLTSSISEGKGSLPVETTRPKKPFVHFAKWHRYYAVEKTKN